MIDLSIHAFAQPLHKVLGIFIPLIVVNCIVLARVESFAAKNAPLPSIVDGLAMGLGLTLVLSLLGGLRELVGKGTLFSGLDLALGPAAKPFVLTVIPDYHGFLLAILPPGAFIGLALLIATRNWLESRKDAAQPASFVAEQAA
jgi:electron transport complex protein RnfE